MTAEYYTTAAAAAAQSKYDMEKNMTRENIRNVKC